MSIAMSLKNYSFPILKGLVFSFGNPSSRWLQYLTPIAFSTNVGRGRFRALLTCALHISHCKDYFGKPVFYF